jgi:[acyl-carrier-protein] S-malonyltransferase
LSNKTYILCPGQGAQAIGMGKDFYDASPLARDIFDHANQVLGFDLTGACFNGPEERLNQTDVSQPALYVAGIASYVVSGEMGTFSADSVTAYAGLSLGEYTALRLAGVFSFEDGLKLVQKRGQYMQEAAVAMPSGMVAIMGADETQVRDLCGKAATGGEVLVPANFNAPGQIVVSGSKSACERALPLAEAAGFKAMALKVAGAFHSPLMQPAADRMSAELAKVEFSRPKKPVYSNVTAAPHGDPASIKKLLVDQIVNPVRWDQTMTTLIADGGADARFVELTPGRTLAGLAKRINRRLPVENVAPPKAE